MVQHFQRRPAFRGATGDVERLRLRVWKILPHQELPQLAGERVQCPRPGDNRPHAPAQQVPGLLLLESGWRSEGFLPGAGLHSAPPLPAAAGGAAATAAASGWPAGGRAATRRIRLDYQHFVGEVCERARGVRAGGDENHPPAGEGTNVVEEVGEPLVVLESDVDCSRLPLLRAVLDLPQRLQRQHQVGVVRTLVSQHPLKPGLTEFLGVLGEQVPLAVRNLHFRVHPSMPFDRLHQQ